MYSIKMLCQRSNISQQTFYRLIKENDEFRKLVETDRQKRGNSYHYSENVLQWLLDYYFIPSEQTEGKPTLQEENPVEASEIHSEPFETVDREKPLIDKINALEGEIRTLEAKLESTENERKMLFTQNAQLIMLLGQEKQEKQAFLPSPKKPLIERIKSFILGDKRESPSTPL